MTNDLLINSIVNKLYISDNQIDITYETNSIMERADEYGNEMEELYNEPIEYETSKCEVIDMWITELIRSIQKIDTDLTKITDLYIDDEFIIQVKSCQSTNKSMCELYSYFPNLII